MALFFGFGESLIHTVFGIAMKKKFKSQGKRTIYGPGSITAYVYFLTIGSIAAQYLTQATFDAACLKTFIFCMFITAGVFIVGMEKLLANPNSEYAFPDEKYFEKFIQK